MLGLLMTPCAHCPCPAEGLTCPALASGHARYCQWCDPAHPDHNPEWCARLVSIARREPESTRNVASVPPRPYPDIPLAGDVVEAMAKRLGADRLASWWEAMTGLPCGCAERREKLNRATERLLRWFGGSAIEAADQPAEGAAADREV
jgi:hypothetical protein